MGRLPVTGSIVQTAGAVAATGTLTLVSASSITQTGGTVAAGTLTGSSATTTALTSTGNAVGTLAGFTSNGGFTLADSTGLAVTQPVSDATSIT